MLSTLSWNVFQPTLCFFHEVVAVQRQRGHTCFKKCAQVLLCQRKRKGKKETLQAFFFFLTLLWIVLTWTWNSSIKTIIKQIANPIFSHDSNPKLTLKFLVSANNVICCSSKWQCHTSCCLVFVPWALHSSCASLRLSDDTKASPGQWDSSEIKGQRWFIVC